MSPTRRQVLKWSLGVAGAGVAGGVILRPLRPAAELAPVSDIAVQLFEMLDEKERSGAVFRYEDPLRQFHNRGLPTGGYWGFRLRRATRQVLVDLVHASLSVSGRQKVPDQLYMSIPGVRATQLAIFGDPRNPPYQILVTGAHLNLRIGRGNREAVAFGGPQVYGDQRGNGVIGLPGNAYRDQMLLGQQLVSSLTPGERKRVRQPVAPAQTVVQLQGASGAFQGVAIANLARANRKRAHEMVATILDTYAAEDVAYAWECINQNGGVDALHFADYALDHEGGQNFGDGPSQIFRFEGPTAVFHYRGTPHLHALFNVGMDGERPLSVGEVVAENPAPLEGDDVKALFEEILLGTTGADLAYYHPDAVAGRLRAGTVRTGDIYSLESWEDQVSVVEIRGANLSPALADALKARGDTVQSKSAYKVATTSFIAENLADEVIGSVESMTTGMMLREAAILHLKANGFPSTA